MTDKQIMSVSRRLLRPYRIPPECPYLSEDQRELSTLDLKGRSAWMAEWLALADMADKASLRRKPSLGRSLHAISGSRGACPVRHNTPGRYARPNKE